MAAETLSWVSIKKTFPVQSDAALTTFWNWAQLWFPLVAVLALYRLHHSNSCFFLLFYFLFCYFSSSGKQHISRSAENQTMASLSNKTTVFLRLFSSFTSALDILLMYISCGRLYDLCFPESGGWCRSQSPGNLITALGSMCSAQLGGFPVHLLEMENAVV